MITPTKLEALDLTLSVIAQLADVRDAIRRKDRNLSDQLTRAATSVALNLSEANGSDPGNKRARLHTALGSARETRTARETIGSLPAPLPSARRARSRPRVSP